MNENDISYKIIGTAIGIHRNIGAGLLESAYEKTLAFDLKEYGFKVKQQVAMPFIYKDVKQDVGYRLDMLVDDKGNVEVKVVETLASVHFA